MPATQGTTASIVVVTMVAAADLTGLSALEPHWAAIVASTIGALAGTVIMPMMKNKPIPSVRTIVGYILAGLVMVYITHDLSPSAFADITLLPNGELLWSQSTAFRHVLLTFVITRTPALMPLLRRLRSHKIK